jgi:hypothetical protein
MIIVRHATYKELFGRSCEISRFIRFSLLRNHFFILLSPFCPEFVPSLSRVVPDLSPFVPSLSLVCPEFVPRVFDARRSTMAKAATPSERTKTQWITKNDDRHEFNSCGLHEVF